MSRVPLRVKLTLAFAVAMAVLLTALGLFVYLRFESQLDDAVTSGLESRAHDLKAVLAKSASGHVAAEDLLGGDDTFAEILTPSGSVVQAPGDLRGEVVLGPDEVARAAQGRLLVDHSGVQGFPGRVRVLAVPAEARGRRFVLVVGASLEDRDAAIANLRRLMLIGGPVALALASAIGYAVSSAALRPVERMRRRAATISAAELDERLPVPPSRDEVARLGATLNEMLSRLETAIARERRFVDDASHELRTPLAMHKAELELALRYGDDPAELKAAIASAAEEADRVIQLAEDLLVIARSDKGQLGVNPEAIPVQDLLEGLRERFGSRVATAERNLTIEDSGDAAVSADRLRVDQALTNLVDNALRHGGGAITLRAERHRDRVRIHVSDEGPGFPPKLLGRAFERFARADSARAGEGTGLGLAIVETIAQAHGGDVGAANRSNGGADVFIELPTAVRTAQAPA
jgi:heavy metal sensor kinase